LARVEKQPTEEELETARARAHADAEERFAYEASGREPDNQPGEQPFAYAPEDVQVAYARAYEDALAALRRRTSTTPDR
jgi:DNA-binding helix-hairpin-helix protein with protein kinase domain